jgi:hypothetical protein
MVNAPATPTTSIVPNATNSLSSSVFDGSIDHIWISFPEPPHHHTHSTSNAPKRPRTSTSGTTNATQQQQQQQQQQMPTPKKLFSYTRYDWNFLSTLSPTVLGWFCVINRIQKPVEEFLQQREKRIDAILAYFLIETTPKSTLLASKFYHLFTPKTKSLLTNPVCQLVSELRKHVNRNMQMHRDLQPNLIPETQILKQGIREACRGWAQTLKQQSTAHSGSLLPSTVPPANTSPMVTNHLPTTNTHYNDIEQPPAVVRAPTMVDRVQRLIGHEFVIAHSRATSTLPMKQHVVVDHTVTNGSAIRRRTATQNIRSTVINPETVPDVNDTLAGVERRRTSSFLGKK